jgi:glycyl-tRNA synthetase beta chain
MSDRQDFLIELGTEELPPKALLKLAVALKDGITAGLTETSLESGEALVYAAPRRLAVLVKALQTRQQDTKVQKRGPAVAAAFDDDGNPTKAALGFARSSGVEIADLERLKTDKGEWLVCNIEQTGQAAAQLLPAIVEKSLATLPIPKRMRWGSRDVEFVRPVHWLVMLLGSEVVPASVLGLTADRVTRGHRFHHADEISISHSAEYADVLRNTGKVIADFAERRDLIEAGVNRVATDAGGTALVDADLLDEVTALVEWPVPVAGNFDKEFLELPSEVLITTMKDNQKYFPLFDSSNNLMPMFITVSNIESADMSQVITGNEVVVRPRLADAMFFWQQDRKKPLESHAETLKNVVFQTKLGTVYDKTTRIESLAVDIAGQIGANVDQASRAAKLSKCDLMTEMVGEFASTQGVMGEYYAKLEGEPEAVCTALREQYLPRYADDELAASGVGQALAIADRLDMLVGIFGIGQRPTGVKDPYALRRLSLAVLRTMIECKLPLDVEALLKKAAALHGNNVNAEECVPEVFEFMLERLRAYYTGQGVLPQVFDSVVAVRPTSALDFDKRVKAVTEFMQLPEAESLAAANKRINNILRKNPPPGGVTVNASLFENDEEGALYSAMSSAVAEVEPLFDSGDYASALKSLAQLRAPVDAFFDEVMVMAEDESQRNNRLALLADLQRLFSHVADLGGLQT